MKMANGEALINLTKALDSMRNVALAEDASIGNDKERTQYSDFVTRKVKDFLADNKKERRDKWRDHGKRQSGAKSQLCPPGFEEKDGLCVPIRSE